MQSKISLLFALFVVTICTSLSSQVSRDRILLSEIFIKIENPIENWIEVFNPCADTLVLYGLHMSHVRSLNVFPREIKKSGGLKIAPKSYAILCANNLQFASVWGNEIYSIEIPMLASFAKSGFISVMTMDLSDENADGIRYGNPSKSFGVEHLFGRQVLSFSSDEKSFSRDVNDMTDFIETNPTPGRPTGNAF
jgi:hypothetical protein